MFYYVPSMVSITFTINSTELYWWNFFWKRLTKYTVKNCTELNYYSCCLSTATIEYSCSSVCLSVCVCVSVCVYDNSKNNGSIHLKLEHIVVYENSLEEFDIEHCPIKVKVTA